MKKFPAIILTTSLLATGFSSTFGNPSIAKAESNQSTSFNNSTTEVVSETQLRLDDSTILQFESVADKLAYQKLPSISKIPSTNNPGSTASSKISTPQRLVIDGAPATLVSSVKKNGIFGGYISSDWGKRSSYAPPSGSYSVSATVEGVGFSFTLALGDGATYPADKTRYSKLGKFADITVNKYKVYKPTVATPLNVTKIAKRATYVKVVYK